MCIIPFLKLIHTDLRLDREEATKEDFSPEDGFDEPQDDEWDQAENWEGAEEVEADVTDENREYLNFLHEEVSYRMILLRTVDSNNSKVSEIQPNT